MEQQLTRIAVKIGSNVLTRRDGTLDVTRMSALVDQVAELHKAGVEIILVFRSRCFGKKRDTPRQEAG